METLTRSGYKSKRIYTAFIIGAILAFLLVFFGVQRVHAQRDDIDPRYSPPASAPAKNMEDLCVKRWAADAEAQKRYCLTPDHIRQNEKRERHDKNRIRTMIETKGFTFNQQQFPEVMEK